MSNFKVVYRADDNSSSDAPLWEPSCPVQILAIQVSRNTETSEAYLQLKVRNISSVTIESLFAAATIVYANGKNDHVALEYLDQVVYQSGIKTLKAVRLPHADVQSASVSIERIECENGRWESSKAPIRVPSTQSLKLSEPAACERAYRLAQENVDPEKLSGRVYVEDSWWVCSCGQLNVSREACCECRTSKQTLLDLENDDTLSKACTERKSSDYDRALQLASQKPTEKSLSQAIALLEAISPWENADNLASDLKLQLAALRRKTTRRVVTAVSVAVVVVLAAIAGYFAFTHFSTESRIKEVNNALSGYECTVMDASLDATIYRYSIFMHDVCDMKIDESTDTVTFVYTRYHTGFGATSEDGEEFTREVSFDFTIDDYSDDTITLELGKARYENGTEQPDQVSNPNEGNEVQVHMDGGKIASVTGSVKAINIDEFDSANLDLAVESVRYLDSRYKDE